MSDSPDKLLDVKLTKGLVESSLFATKLPRDLLEVADAGSRAAVFLEVGEDCGYVLKLGLDVLVWGGQQAGRYQFVFAEAEEPSQLVQHEGLVALVVFVVASPRQALFIDQLGILHELLFEEIFVAVTQRSLVPTP